MKKIFLTFLFLVGLSIHAEALQKDVNLKINDISSIRTVSFEFVNGKANIEGANIHSIEIKGTVKVKGKDQSVGEEILKKVNFKIKKHGDELEISLNYDELKKELSRGDGFLGLFCSWGRQPEISVNLDIKLPESLDVDFSGVNFDLEVLNVRNVEVENVNGDVKVENSRKVKCESVNGNVVFKNIEVKASCEVVNGNFSLDTKSSKISSISFESVNGNASIKLPLKTIGSISTESLTSKTTLILKGKKTVKKNLEWKGDGDCDIEVQTINGRITIEGF
ncbi:hypothetical protein TTHT_1672 [Thermotomaculum hydrothermale]|uniref:Adhesin domain-containing protein n=1 Tax=Thermotomaculum hydrothermale TaxID=981385 RepID=A0A7R6SZ08_9BACT|nr:hypothetical protein [Thermotomaculum hydrothermale]BBB33151.1 hypothetical protein TTHT_1672 [Thermotomaculum hydrothermale]